jgi:mutator protein MutT
MDTINKNAELFKYCPKCGAATLHFARINLLICGNCGFEFYLNNAVAVVAVIKNDKNQILLVKRAKEPAKGLLDLPGGCAAHGESAEEALKREIEEELGVNIASARYFCSAANIYKYKSVTYSTVDLAFICKVDDISKAKPADDAHSIYFIAPNKIHMEKVAFESTKKIISFYLTCL